MKRLWMLMMVLAVALALGACAGTGQGNTSTAAGTATATEPLTDDPADISGTTATGSAPAEAQGGSPTCDNVRCASCPEGQTPALTPPVCCRCVPITEATRVDCSTVRCAACPEGQHPKLTPPDCCRCVPD